MSSTEPPPVRSPRPGQSAPEVFPSALFPPPKPPRTKQENIYESISLQSPLPSKSVYSHLDHFNRQLEHRADYDVLEPAPLQPAPLPPPLPPRRPAPRPAPLPPAHPSGNTPKTMVGMNNVARLSDTNYEMFIKDKEKALIMFYDGADMPNSTVGRKFGLTAAFSQNNKHAFGSVDCGAHPAICCRENINVLPVMRLYSNGFEVSTIRFLEKITPDQIEMLIVMSPVLTQPRSNKQ